MNGKQGPGRAFDLYQPVVEWDRAAEADSLKLSLPGFKREQIRVLVDNHGHLRTSGERPVGGNRWSRFQKDFQIPASCNVDGIRAKFENETLTITLPKTTASPPQAAAPSSPAPSQPAPPPPRPEPKSKPSTQQAPAPSSPAVPAPPPRPVPSPFDRKPKPEPSPPPKPSAPAPEPPKPVGRAPPMSPQKDSAAEPTPSPPAPAPEPTMPVQPSWAAAPPQRGALARLPSTENGAPAEAANPEQPARSERKASKKDGEEKDMARELGMKTKEEMREGKKEEVREEKREDEEGAVMGEMEVARRASASRKLLVNVAVAVAVLVGITLYVWHTLRKAAPGDHGKGAAESYTDEM